MAHLLVRNYGLLEHKIKLQVVTVVSYNKQWYNMNYKQWYNMNYLKQVFSKM